MQELVQIFTSAVVVGAVAFATLNLCLGLVILTVIRAIDTLSV
jgi:hypothetical protein